MAIEIPRFLVQHKFLFLTVGGIGAAWLVYRMGASSSAGSTTGNAAGATYAGVPIFSGGGGGGISADNAGSSTDSTLSDQVGKLIDAINASNAATGTAPATIAPATSTQAGGAAIAPAAAPQVQALSASTLAAPATKTASKAPSSAIVPGSAADWAQTIAYENRNAMNLLSTVKQQPAAAPAARSTSSNLNISNGRAGANVSGGVTGAKDVGQMAPGISFGQSVAIGLGVAAMPFGGILGPAIGFVKMATAPSFSSTPRQSFASTTPSVGSLQSGGGYAGPRVTTPGFSITRTGAVPLSPAQVNLAFGSFGYQGDVSSKAPSSAGTTRDHDVGPGGGGRGGSSTSGGGYGSEAGTHGGGVGGLGSNRSA